MSNNQAQQLVQVLRPYFTKLDRALIDDLTGVQQFLSDFINNTELNDALRSLYPNYNQLFDIADEQEQHLIQHYYKVRLFQFLLAKPLALSLINNFESDKLYTILCGLKQSALNFQSIDENQRAQVLGNGDIIAVLLISHCSNLIESTYHLPKLSTPKLTDLSFDGTSEKLLSLGKIHKLNCVAGSPNEVKGYNNYFKSSELAKKCHDISVSKCILHVISDDRYYYDKKGTAYHRSIPLGTSPKDYYLTQTLADFLAHYKSSIVKLPLTSFTYKLFAKHDTMKAFNKHSDCLFLTLATPSNVPQTPNAFDLGNLFADCELLVNAIKHGQTFNTKRTKVKVSVQFDASLAGYLQVVLTKCAL